MDLDRFCSVVHWFATRNAEKESDIRNFEARLWRPPSPAAPIHPASPWSPENETAAFAAVKAGTAP